MNRSLFPKVFLWLFIGLFVSFVTAFLTSLSPTILSFIFSGPWYLVIVLLELGLVLFLLARLAKMRKITAMISFIVYAIVNGLTFSVIFVGFQIESIFLIFGVTSLLFLLFGMIGFKTKIDLSKFSTFLFMGLLGIIIVTLINYFLGNQMVDYIVAWVGVILFIGYIAYDIQKIKRLDSYGAMEEDKVAVIGALELYLDFINLFLRLLAIFGKRKD